jgi:hypothetical protein
MVEGDHALQDAVTAQTLRPSWPKAYYRMGAAFMLLKVNQFNIKYYNCISFFFTCLIACPVVRTVQLS